MGKNASAKAADHSIVQKSSNTFDTIIRLPACDINTAFTIYNLAEAHIEKANAFLKVVRRSNDRILFTDSFYSMSPEISLIDFNGDHIKDLLIFASNGMRANPTYHLYVITGKNLYRVKGFENLTSPAFDSVNNIITSVGLGGPDVY